MEKLQILSPLPQAKDGFLLFSPKGVSTTAEVCTSTQTISRPGTKASGRTTQTLKISCFPVPPILQKTQSSNEKISQNNRIIQDILIENKRGNQYEQQQQQQQQSSQHSNLQSHLMRRVKNGSFAKKIEEVAKNQNKLTQLEEQNSPYWNGEIQQMGNELLAQSSTPRQLGAATTNTRTLLLANAQKQHRRSHEQSFKSSLDQDNPKRIKTAAASATRISISMKFRENKAQNSSNHDNQRHGNSTLTYLKPSEDINRMKTSSFVGNMSSVEFPRASGSMTSTGKRRNIHSTEKTKQSRRLSEIVRDKTPINFFQPQTTKIQEQSQQQYQSTAPYEIGKDVQINEKIPNIPRIQFNKGSYLKNSTEEEMSKQTMESQELQNNEHILLSSRSSTMQGHVQSSQYLNSNIGLNISSANQISIPIQNLGIGGRKFNQTYQELHKILLKEQKNEKSTSIQIINSASECLLPLSPRSLVVPTRESIHCCSREATRRNNNKSQNQNRSSLQGFDEQYQFKQHQKASFMSPAGSTVTPSADSEYLFLQFDDLSNEETIRQYELQYESLLKKDISWALTDAPASKSEVIKMKLWLQSQLNATNNLTGMPKDLCMIGLLRLSLKELLRQITLECSDRGEMIKAIIKQSMIMQSERLNQQHQDFLKSSKQVGDKFLQSHQTYQEIFSSKDKENENLRAQLQEISTKLTQSLKELEETGRNEKQLRDQINKFKEVAAYLRNASDLSNNENLKLRQKLNKVNQIRTQKEEMIRQAAKQQTRFAQRTGASIVYGEDFDSNESSINSDLFDNKQENKQSEKQISIGGVQETIENLNYVPFTNPDDFKKMLGEETQTGNSLLVLGQMCNAEVQTDLAQLLGDEFDGILTNSGDLEKFIYKVENNDAQIQYFKQREFHLLEEIDVLKNQQLEEGMHASAAIMFPSNNSQTNFNVDLIDSPTGENETVISEISHSSVKRKKIEEVDNVLTEKYKNIMEKLNIENKLSSSSSGSDVSDDEDGTGNSKKRNTLLKTVQAKIGGRQLGQKINQVESLFNDVGRVIVDKVKKNKYPKFRNFMPLPTLLKQINLVYLERMKMTNENGRVKEQECSNFTYYFLTKLYGFKKIVDQKYIIFILSVKKYSNILRVNLFARFLGLLDGRNINFSLDEYNKYIEVLNFVFNISTVGLAPSPYDIDSRYLVPFIRVMAFVGKGTYLTIEQNENILKQQFLQILLLLNTQGTFADTRMTFEENNEFRKVIESLKETDPRGLHSAGIIDFDVFLNKMLEKYRQLVNRAKTYVINAFAASDLDGNGVCNLDEFLILNRHIETDLYDEEVLSQIFQENADRIIEGESNLSFDKFAIVCVDYNLFSDEAQDRFLGIRHKREIDFKMQELQSEWVFRERELRTIFEQLTLISPEQKRKWLEIISVLSAKLENVSQGEQKPLLIAQKILLNEARGLLQLEDESRKDAELLENYEKIALKEQKDYQQHIQQELSMCESSESSSPGRGSPRKLKNRSSFTSNQLKIPGINAKKNLSIYSMNSSAQQELESPSPSAPNDQIQQFFKLPPDINVKEKKKELLSLIVPESSKEIPAPPSLFLQETDQSSSTKSISETTTRLISTFSGSLAQQPSLRPEINLNDANFIELMIERLKNVTNKERFLQEILFKNGVEEITEAQELTIQNILQSLEIAELNPAKSSTAKQLLFQFFMKVLNKDFNPKNM